ncbi:hypothetical protein EGM51_11655 [Verrucomicrobia bacterium S94]|nr:hypothetical protein EGM51_11655 [Verrucomicrobia bacterium S94]
MVESCLAIIMLCLILFGLLQVSYLIMARDVISFSAFASARALTVGMDEEFVERVARVTTIPTAGPPYGSSTLQHQALPDGDVGTRWDLAVSTSLGSQQFWYENYYIPFYLGAEDESQLDSILNYFHWLTSDTEISVESAAPGDEDAWVNVSQNVPLIFPFASGLFMDADRGMVVRYSSEGEIEYSEVPLYTITQEIRLENHSALYLTTQ